METIITVQWIDAQGDATETRFHREYDALRFEESLDCEGLSHRRADRELLYHKPAVTSDPGFDGRRKAA